MKNSLNVIMSVLILIVLAAGVYFIVQTIRESAQQATAPFAGVEQANQALQTQVSQLMNPTPTIIPDPVTYINEVRALARLETIQYSVEKVLTGSLRSDVLLGTMEDKILFVAHGTVIAGIDMEKIQPTDMRFENGVLYVRLPPAEIFIATLDNEKSYVYNRETGIFADPDPNLETEVRRQAEDEILKAALEDGILTQAQINAEAYLYRFFSALGYDNIIFED
ncbi:MAG: DUF4230 domain-containing protein [Chloroflexota bacterium]